MEARGPTASNVVRKTIVASMCELSVSRLRELLAGGAGGLLLLIPSRLLAIPERCEEEILALEEELMGAELEIPVYIAEVKLQIALKSLAMNFLFFIPFLNS